MRAIHAPLLAAAALALGGCAAGRYCLEEQAYQSAESVPALQGVEELKLPESQSAFVVPPPPKTSEPFGKVVTDAEGEEHIHCLDKPPPMPEPRPEPENAS